MKPTVLTWITRPRVYLPVLLGVVLLSALLALGNLHDVLLLVGRFQPRYLLAFAAAMLAYETVRCLQWRFLLNALGIRVPVRTQIITYVTGEVMKSLPVGNFFPDYLLRQAEGTDFGLASSVTLAINLMEVALTLVGLVALDVRGWAWLRPLIVFGLAGFALLVWLCRRWTAWAAATNRALHVPEWLVARRGARAALAELRQFRAGTRAILRPRVLLPAALFSATYLALGGLGLALLTWGFGLQQITLAQALAVYCFSLAFATIIPLPMDLGSTEMGGVGVFLALGAGVGKSAAVGVMLLDRTLALGCIVVLALLIGVALQAEVRAVLRSCVRAPSRAPLPSASSQPVWTEARGKPATMAAGGPALAPRYALSATALPTPPERAPRRCQNAVHAEHDSDWVHSSASADARRTGDGDARAA